MSISSLGARPEERFKFAIGLLAGIVVAVPVNVLNLTNWQSSLGFGYVLIGVLVAGTVFYKRSFVVGVCGAIVLISLPQAIAAVLQAPLTSWHVSAGVLWLVALAILGCLYLMREAETRTDADIDGRWLFRSQR